MTSILAAVLLFIPALSGSALTPAAESLLKGLGLDARSSVILAIAADSVKAESGEVYTLDGLAAKGDVAAVKAFLVTREFFHDFEENWDIEFPNDELYDIRYLTGAERVYMAKKLMEDLPVSAKGSALRAAMKPATATFLRSIDIDPESKEISLIYSEGPIETSYQGDPRVYSLDTLAAEKAKNGIKSFIGARNFIRQLKKDFAGTRIPTEGYDGNYLTLEERKLALKKVFPD